MEIRELIESPIIEKCVNQLKSANSKKKEADYNIFTFLSSKIHKEDFHSNVVASFLDSKGGHEEGGVFLDSFLDFLNENYNFNISKAQYANAIIKREFGNQESRLDILIIGQGRCIVLENKMNNATDMENQLDRYYSLASNQGLIVDALIYLTLDGSKKAPIPENLSARNVLINIVAFENTENDLVNGWLKECLNLSSNEESKSLIYQYVKLIKHLNKTSMESQSENEFYKMLGSGETIGAINAIVSLQKQMPTFRIKRISSLVKDILPFKSSRIYSPYPAWIYQFYDEGFNSFKIDYCIMEDGSAEILFWNPPLDKTEKGQSALMDKLDQIKMLDEFKEEDGCHGFKKRFDLTMFENFHEIDDAIVKFLNNFLSGLRKLN